MRARRDTQYTPRVKQCKQETTQATTTTPTPTPTRTPTLTPTPAPAPTHVNFAGETGGVVEDEWLRVADPGLLQPAVQRHCLVRRLLAGLVVGQGVVLQRTLLCVMCYVLCHVT